jgi:hypothetical protein
MKKLFIILFLTGSLQAGGLTLDEMISQIRVDIRDNSTINQHYSSSTLITKINIVQENIARYTRCLEVRISTPAFTGQEAYLKPGNCLQLERVGFSSVTSTPSYKRLQYVTIAGLDIDTPFWQTQGNGLPTKYYELGNSYYLYPKPTSTYAVTVTTQNAIQVDYIAIPDAFALSDGSKYPFNESTRLYPYHDLIIKGVKLELGYFDGNTYYALLEKMIKELVDRPDSYNQELKFK